MPTPKRAQVHIDTSQIPESSIMGMLAILYEETAAYFQEPGVAEEFERWKVERAKQAG